MSRKWFTSLIVALAVFVLAAPALAATTVKSPRDAASGSAAGKWATFPSSVVPSRGCSIVAGRWADGKFAGLFGVRKNGKQVWFAKVISADGTFLGFQSHTLPHADGQLLYHVIRPDADGCAEGFRFGKWHRVPDRGVFWGQLPPA